jgi:hypothetical protein
VVAQVVHTVTVVQEQEPVAAAQAEVVEQVVQAATAKVLPAALILPVAHPTIWVQVVAEQEVLAVM